MSHEIWENDSLFSVNEVPWHGLGLILDKPPKDSKDALKKAHLDWDVIQAPVIVKIEKKQHKLEDYIVNIRSDTREPLGVVTGRYKPVQNIAAFQFLDNLIGSDMHFETAGSFMNGRRVWVMARLPEWIEVAGDPIAQYAFISNSHDGKSGINSANTPVRIVCKNTELAALRGAKRVYTITHRGTPSERLAEARKMLGMTVNYYEQFKKVGDKLGLKKIGAKSKSIDKYLADILPTPDAMGDRAVGNREQAREAIRSIYNDGNSTAGNAPGTFWCLYNAATEYADHKSNERKEGGRFQRSIDDPDGFKSLAWRAALEHAGVKA